MFSRRSDWNAPLNRLTRAREARAAAGAPLLDLTISNPTQAGIGYPHDELAEAIARGARANYDPQPLGIRTAREAVAAHLGAGPEDVVITASTSEAYSFLFKLLTDPGDDILTATPTYPLLDHLAALELISIRSFALDLHRRWELDLERLREAISPRTRAVVIVNPNNPTGSYVLKSEQEMLGATALPVIADEVFFDYSVEPPDAISSAAESGLPAFTLGGLSKSAGLPHYKLGWIRLSGPAAWKRQAINALELIADNFLSVSTPVQQALPDLLRIGARIREAISSRAQTNVQVVRRLLPPSVTLLPIEGGWSAVFRVPRTRTDEELALALLDRGVVVHPGYFFDFAGDGFIVISLLTPSDVLEEGVRRIVESLPS